MLISALGLACLILAWIVPGHYFPWTTFLQEVIAAGAVWLCGLAVLATNTRWPVRMPHLAWGAVVLACVPVAQWAFGLFPFASDAVLPAAYLAGFALAVVAAAQMQRNHGDAFLLLLMGCMLAAAVVSTGIGLSQWLEIDASELIERLDRGDRVSANLKQPNHLASLLGMGLVSLIWMFERRHAGAFVTGLGSVYLGLGLALTQSRTAWLFVVVVAALWFVQRRHIDFRLPARALALWLIGFFLLTANLSSVSEWLLTSTSSAPIGQRVQGSLRLIHWETLADAIADRPWFGYGWQQVPVAQTLFAPDHPATGEWLAYSHNLLIDLLVWNGVPLGLLVIGVLILWFVAQMRRGRSASQWATLAMIAVLATHATLEFPLAYTYFLLPLALFVGVLEGSVQSTASKTVSVGRAPFGLALLSLGCVVALLSRDYLEFEESTRIASLKDAGYLREGKVATPPDVAILDAQREFVRLWLFEVHPGMTAREVEWTRNVSHRFPVPPALFRHAAAAAFAGSPEEARRTLWTYCRTTSEGQCARGRALWAALAIKHPALQTVRYPLRHDEPWVPADRDAPVVGRTR